MPDNTYFEFLAEENAAQRNGALDELSAARTQLRLSNIQVGALETENFYLKEDLGLYASELDAMYDYANAAGQHIEELERNADQAMADTLKRLRERIDGLEAEVSRLVGDAPLDAFDTQFDAPETFLLEEQADPAGAPPQDAEATQDETAVSGAALDTTDRLDDDWK